MRPNVFGTKYYAIDTITLYHYLILNINFMEIINKLLHIQSISPSI